MDFGKSKEECRKKNNRRCRRGEDNNEDKNAFAKHADCGSSFTSDTLGVETHTADGGRRRLFRHKVD